MSTIRLEGCRSEPMVSYLKALGILRLVAEQRDPKVKALWEGSTFCLETSLDAEGLISFLCEGYEPTPIVSPWNGGSGFWASDNKRALRTISASSDERVSCYRNVIEQINSWPVMPGDVETVGAVEGLLVEICHSLPDGKDRNALEDALARIHHSVQAAGDNATGADQLLTEIDTQIKNSKGKEKRALIAWQKSLNKAQTAISKYLRSSFKQEILSHSRAQLPDSCVSWIDAVGILRQDDKPVFNPLLGSGGNEGRLDFSNNFMQHIVSLLLEGAPERSRLLARCALHGTPTAGLTEAAIGQFSPGQAGGFNQGSGVETKNFKINPWDFILAIEGSIVLSSAVVRRNSASPRSMLSSPFTVRTSSVGFSSSTQDESSRGETWLPLWTRSANYRELRHLFGEGRNTIGRRRSKNGIEFCRAISTLGVDRGVDSFLRYLYLERRGKSYVATPVGRLPVRFQPAVRLLDELDRVLEPLDGFLRQFKNIPASLNRARRLIDEAVYSCSVSPSPSRFSALVGALGEMERLLACRDRGKKPSLSRPLGGLSLQWLAECDDASVEVRLAASLASIQATGKVGPIRSQLAGVDAAQPWIWSSGSGKRAWQGSDLPRRMGTLLLRRLLEAEKTSGDVPLFGSLPVSPWDIMLFVYGETDDRRIEELLWGFTLLNWRTKLSPVIRSRWLRPVQEGAISRTWALIRLVLSPHEVRDTKFKKETRVATLLRAGQIERACEVALRRLRVSDLSPHDVRYDGAGLEPARLLASLLFPTSKNTVQKLEGLVLKKKDQNFNTGDSDV